jgi:hypothetical protein
MPCDVSCGDAWHNEPWGIEKGLLQGFKGLTGIAFGDKKWGFVAVRPR